MKTLKILLCVMSLALGLMAGSVQAEDNDDGTVDCFYDSNRLLPACK